MLFFVFSLAERKNEKQMKIKFMKSRNGRLVGDREEKGGGVEPISMRVGAI
jgi:hypothetical protein